MDPNQPDPTRSFGRGRPREMGDLRRPFGYTYAPDAQYVPAEGSNNILQLNPTTMAEMGRQTAVHNGEAAVFQVGIAGDFDIPLLNNAGGDKMGSEVNSVLSPYAPEFVPRNFRPEPRTNQAPTGHDSADGNSSSESYPIEKLRQFLFEITLNPGKFESKIEQLIDCFNDYICNDETMRAVVHIIFDESVRQPNFRYNGARLSKHLCSDLTASNQRNFLQFMLNRCRMEHARRENLSDAEDGGVYLRGVAMFLAEIFSQLEVSHQKIKIISEYLISLIETLLSKPTTDNLKCTCQILKLVGVYLDDQERNKTTSPGVSPKMDKIMESLSIVAQNQEFPKDIRSMVSNVVELRSSNWGRACEDETVIEEIPPPASNEPVMYGPDGKPISDEESVFLHTQYSNSASDSEDYDTLENDVAYDEMSDEILAAYEVYLSELQQ